MESPAQNTRAWIREQSYTHGHRFDPESGQFQLRSNDVSEHFKQLAKALDYYLTPGCEQWLAVHPPSGKTTARPQFWDRKSMAFLRQSTVQYVLKHCLTSELGGGRGYGILMEQAVLERFYGENRSRNPEGLNRLIDSTTTVMGDRKHNQDVAWVLTNIRDAIYSATQESLSGDEYELFLCNESKSDILLRCLPVGRPENAIVVPKASVFSTAYTGYGMPHDGAFHVLRTPDLS